MAEAVKQRGLFEQYQTASNLERDGVWCIPNKLMRDTPEENRLVTQFLLGRYGLGNPLWAAAFDRMSRPDRKRLESGDMSQAAARKLTMDTFVEACVHDWKNYPDNANPQPFSKAAARELLERKDMHELYVELLEFSRDAAMYLAAGLDRDSGNSLRSSSGGSGQGQSSEQPS